MGKVNNLDYTIFLIGGPKKGQRMLLKHTKVVRPRLRTNTLFFSVNISLAKENQMAKPKINEEGKNTFKRHGRSKDKGEVGNICCTII